MGKIVCLCVHCSLYGCVCVLVNLSLCVCVYAHTHFSPCVCVRYVLVHCQLFAFCGCACVCVSGCVCVVFCVVPPPARAMLPLGPGCCLFPPLLRLLLLPRLLIRQKRAS